MKYRLFYIFLFLTASAPLFAQDLPNGGFENWEKGAFNVDQPKGWFTSSLLTPFSAKKAVTKSEDKFTGTYALRLETISENNEIIPGWAISGKFDVSDFEMGFPYTGRPSKMIFNYKYLPTPGDTMVVYIELRKYIPGYGQMFVGGGYFSSADNSQQYTLGEIDIYYEYSDQPDTAIVIIQSGTDTLRAGSVLYMDNMQFAFALDAPLVQENPVNKSSLLTSNPYPQPVKTNSEINFPVNINEPGCLKFEIFDIAGKHVGTKEETLKPGAASVKYSTQNLKPGLYMYRLSLKNEVTSGKIIITQ